MPETPGTPGIGLDDPLIAPPIPVVEEEIDLEEELWTDDSGEDYSGWYCARANSRRRAPRSGCWSPGPRCRASCGWSRRR